MMDKSARRQKVGKEIDLLLEEDIMSDDAKRKYCEEILEKISHEVELPQECKDYPVVMAMLRKRRSDHNQGSGHDRTDYAIAFDGMIPSEAQAAMAARKNGHLNPCQIKKRMTNRGSTRVW